MINPTLKLTSIAVGVGGIATGAAVGAYQILKFEEKTQEKPKSKITDLLESEKLTILDASADGDSQSWKEKWAAFVKVNDTNGPAEPWKIDNWATKKTNEKGIEEFKKLCDTNSKQDVPDKSDPLYIAVKDNCTKKKDPAT